MTPGEKLAKAFELAEAEKRRFLRGLRQQYPRLTQSQGRVLLVARLLDKSRQELAIYWGKGK
jgi:hypothetical protein